MSRRVLRHRLFERMAPAAFSGRCLALTTTNTSSRPKRPSRSCPKSSTTSARAARPKSCDTP
eukprot:728250-Pleurochrysis_carterae.AAC.1